MNNFIGYIDIMELEFFENILIATLRRFGRLLNNNYYSLVSMTYGDRDGDILEYRSYIYHIKIQIVFTWVTDGLSFNIIFYKNWIFNKKSFNIKDIERNFPEFKTLDKLISEDNYLSVIDSYFEAVQKYLMSVIKGDKWISDFS